MSTMSATESPANKATLVFASTAAFLGGASVAAFAARGQQAAILRQIEVLERNFRQKIQSEIAEEVKAAETRFNASVVQKMSTPITKWEQITTDTNNRVQSLQGIFLNPKQRGTFGEILLENLIRDTKVAVQYDFQAKLSNGNRVDCLLNLPSPIGKMAIDSKFPMIDPMLSEEERNKAVSASLNKHITDIAKKYIVAGETADCAILFLPSESMYLEIVQHHPNIVTKAGEQHVWLACPTTLHAVLTTLQGVVRGITLQNQTREVFTKIEKLTNDVRIFMNKFENAEKAVEKAKKELSGMHVSYEKIRKGKAELDSIVAGGGLDVLVNDKDLNATRPVATGRDKFLPRHVDEQHVGPNEKG